MNVLLSVPVIPSGLSGDPANPSIGGIIITVIILCLFIGLVIYHETKNRKRKTEIPKRFRDDYGKHPYDFTQSCKFREQIIEIGEGTKNGDGEEVMVKMESGKTAVYQLFSERYNTVFEYTGQRNWRYHFVKYA